MALTFMSRDDMSTALRELNQALYVHERWSERIYGVLVCHLAPEASDLADDAFRVCPFGTWYYSSQEGGFREHPGFLAMAVEHERMHRIVAGILLTFGAGEPVAESDYAAFVNAMSRMRLEILNLSRELEDSISRLDPLTGATGRHGMLAHLRRQHEVVTRTQQSCLVAMMDLDYFKNINDGYGHPVGDQVLVATVGHVKTHLRPYDEFFRYGGEEFLLCVPFVDASGALSMVERLREGVAALEIDAGEGRVVKVTASFGLTMLDPGVPVEESIARADRALYGAKSAGRNRSLVWDESLV